MVFIINKEQGAQQYLSASAEYLCNPELYSRMKYPFPKVTEQCLYCGRAGCSRWKGYYIRWVVCTLMKYVGPIAIHLAQCKTRGVDYTYWPDILIPYLQPTIPTLQVFYETWVSSGYSIRKSIDEVVGKIDGEFYLPISVAYQWLRRLSQYLIIYQEWLKIRAPESLGSLCLRGYRREDVSRLFEPEPPWRAKQPSTFSPP